MNDIKGKVIEIIAEKLALSKKEIELSSNFTQNLGADSLDIIELVMAFENEFKINIPDEEAEKIQTVGDAVEYLQKNVKTTESK